MLFHPSFHVVHIDRLFILSHAIISLRSRRSEPEKIKDHTKSTPSSEFSRSTTSTWLIWDIHLTSLV
ncbi:hypothetical protein PRUPE_5G226200 [Prunus persica]|uniref:Uncharacterized protein n=1 Tax=Prunus persica TaxID=3760 RepID=A0A251PCD1_PRUPE|nr:hypothetical protein PRUPE_5G226200 [Prunus persica]